MHEVKIRSLAVARIADRRPTASQVTSDYLVISDLLNNISSRFQDIGLEAYWGHEFDLSGSRDVIDHVTLRLPIGRFLLVVFWNQASISNGFRGIQWRM